MRLVSILGLAALSIASPSAACYTGPMPVAFAGRSSQLTLTSERYLASYADDLGINGKDRLLVVFYDGALRQKSEITLRRARTQAVLTYLLTKGVPSNRVTLATTKKPMERWLKN